MFNTKKTLIRRLDIANIMLNSAKSYNSYLSTKNDEYFVEISKLKRDLAIESRQKEELAELLAEAERDAHCPVDCRHRNTGRGTCIRCTRYPNTKDLYETEDES